MVVPEAAGGDLQDADLNVHRPSRKAARLLDRDRIASFVNSNRFSVLAEEEDDSTLMAVEFPKALQASLEASGAFGAEPEAPLRVGDRRRLGRARAPEDRLRLSRRARAAADERNAAFKALREARPEEVKERWERYAELRKNAISVLCEEADFRVAAAVRRRTKLLKKHPYGGRAYWRSLAALRFSPEGDDCGEEKVTGVPIQDQAGNLVYDPASAARVWREHFVGLIGEPGAAGVDDEGNVFDPCAHLQERPTLRDADDADINRPFDLQELLGALRSLKPHKAPGPDDVPVEILQLADEGEDGKTNAFGKALLASCNAIFAGDAELDTAVKADPVASAAWHTVRIRPIVKKDGDATLPSAHRGIGIQSAVARLLAMLVLRRLAPAVEHARLLDRGQAGFRSREEAVSQVATLLEICGRRRCDDRVTYLLFLDFAAAYDSVPHDVLYAKLERLGIRGHVLEFIRRSLVLNCAQPTIGATASEPFAVRRGLIQGCPLSPLLFNLFINDLFHDKQGISVPGLPDEGPHVVRDLKYADDVVVLSHGPRGVRRDLHRLHRWCVANGMRIGAAKCGLMVVGVSADDTRRRHEELVAGAAQWRIADGAWAGSSPQVPVVSTYKYLGIMVNQHLDVAAMARARAESARRLVGAMRASLCDYRIPCAERIMLVKAFVAPVIMFGAELWAGVRNVVHPLNQLLNEVWRLVLGVPKNASLFCVHRTVACRSARAWSLVASARAYAKWRASCTWMGLLLSGPEFKMRAASSAVWSRSVRLALRRIDKSGESLRVATAGDVSQAKELVGAATEAAEAKVDRSLSGSRWRAYDLSTTAAEASKLARSELRDLKAWEVAQAQRMRVGVFSTYHRLACAELVHPQWEHQCPFCDRDGPEDLPHFLLECPAWSAERGRFLLPVLRRAKVHEWLGVAARRVDATFVLLGGRAEGRSAVSMLRGAKKKKRREEEDVAENKEAENVEPVGGEDHVAVAPVPAGVAAAAAVGPRDAMGRVAAAPLAPGQNKSFRSSGLNWLVGVGRYLRAVCPERTARGPPLSQGRIARGRAELPAPGGGGVHEGGF